MQDDDHKDRNAGLARDIQEHLGRRLRTELNIEAEKPAFLGDSNVPPQFESLVRQLEGGESGERQGYEAVKRALIGDSVGKPHMEPPPAAPSAPLRPRIPKQSD